MRRISFDNKRPAAAARLYCFCDVLLYMNATSVLIDLEFCEQSFYETSRFRREN